MSDGGSYHSADDGHDGAGSVAYDDDSVGGGGGGRPASDAGSRGRRAGGSQRRRRRQGKRSNSSHGVGDGSGKKSRLRQLQEELAAAKEARKLVEQDAQLLANRIALLKQEEEKAWKKIRQTKTRAQEIVALRAENEQRVLERQAAAEELTAQQREVVDRHHLEKQLQRKARERLAAEKEKEKRRAAAEVKASKLKHKREVERQRRAEVAKARRTKASIRQEREAARRRREKAEAERALRNKVEYDQRVEAEERLRLSKEGEVSRLEAMEMALIERLKKTQAQQQKAYHDLEVALAGTAQ